MRGFSTVFSRSLTSFKMGNRTTKPHTVQPAGDNGTAISVRNLAKRIAAGEIKNIVVMAGAGISVSCGIPDFRSPKTGLYHNLQKYDLPSPESVFDLNFFQETDGKAFYELARELLPGKYPPSPTHGFIKLLHEKNVLKRCYTQNIDTLEESVGIPAEYVVAAHGSFGTASCISCRTEVDPRVIEDNINSRNVPIRCEDTTCNGLVKPDIVFFGEDLPARFFESKEKDLKEADLLIIMGTSLQVYPFAGLINEVQPTCPRLLINLEKAGVSSSPYVKSGLQLDSTSNSRDYMIQGRCDDGVRALCDELGGTWRQDLESIIKRVKSKGGASKKRINVTKAFPSMAGGLSYDWKQEG